MSVRVVIADDHPMFREGLRFTLDRCEDISVVGECGDGAAALEQIAELDPDVVLMDLAMPVLDGLTATTRLVESGARAAVLVLTMTEADAGVFAAIRAGARGYLVKGVAPEQVISAVRALAAGNAVFGPDIADRMLRFFTVGGAERPPADRDTPKFPELSPREREVLTHLAAGLSNQEIAAALVISPITARNHVSSILAKLQVANRREAMLRFHQPE